MLLPATAITFAVLALVALVVAARQFQRRQQTEAKFMSVVEQESQLRGKLATLGVVIIALIQHSGDELKASLAAKNEQTTDVNLQPDIDTVDQMIAKVQAAFAEATPAEATPETALATAPPTTSLPGAPAPSDTLTTPTDSAATPVAPASATPVTDGAATDPLPDPSVS